MLKSFPSLMAVGLALMAADDGSTGTNTAAATPAPAPEANPNVAEFEFTNLEGKRAIDLSTIPSGARLELLKGSVRAYIANRLNSVAMRHQKEPAVLAWNAYDEAMKADPLQSTVAKPEGERPATPDYADAYSRAIKDLAEGNIGRKGTGEPKARKTKDPLVAIVTEVVAREIFNSRRTADPKYTYLKAKAEVGADGIAYLNKLIDAKVAELPEAEQAAGRKALEEMRETKYVKPARAMLGMDTNKKVEGLPSIL